MHAVRKHRRLAHGLSFLRLLQRPPSADDRVRLIPAFANSSRSAPVRERLLSFLRLMMLAPAAAIGAVALNKIPNAIVTLREGARSLDPGLEEMARAYRLSYWSKLRNVTLPQLQPYFAAASRSGISLIWKIVLVVELLGRSNGVGFELYLNFQLFNVTAILGYTLAFVAVMLVIEYLLVQPVERHTTRWRNKPV